MFSYRKGEKSKTHPKKPAVENKEPVEIYTMPQAGEQQLVRPLRSFKQILTYNKPSSIQVAWPLLR